MFAEAAPSQLEDYFRIVHDFLYKSFRDDCKLFLGLRSNHQTSIQRRPMISSPASAVDGEAPTTSTGLAAAKEHAAILNLSNVRLSPRLMIREDGTTFGKLKVALDLKIPDICDVEQKLMVGSDGKAVGALSVGNFATKGLKVGGRVVVNTIAPASEDESALDIRLMKPDYYGSITLNRNGFGSTATATHVGARFHDLILGVGYTRKYYALGEADQRAMALVAPPLDQDSQVYVGGGFHGRNWTFGGRLIRVNDLWSCAELALFRKLAASTAVACAYGFDLSVSKAHVTLGASQGLWVRLPSFILASQAPATKADASSLWTDPIPFVVGVKADSYGNALGTIRGSLVPNVHWGVIAKRNLIDPMCPWGFGLTLTMEE